MGLKKPLEIKLQITDSCNFNCDFCFNSQDSKTKGSISKDNAEKIISKVAEEGIKGLRITGGEPFLHKDLFSILSHAKNKGLKTTLNTNAALFKENDVKKIAGLVDQVLVSIHSLKINSNTVKTINNFSEQGLKPRIATILSKENINNLEKFHDLVSRLPFSQWVLLRQIPNEFNCKPVSGLDMQRAVEKIESFNLQRKEKDFFLIENALPFCCWHSERVDKVCLGGIHEDGHSSLFVNQEGLIKPSYFLDPVLGNAFETSFLDAWKSDFMKSMNSLEFIGEECHECSHVLKCMAGSRFSALFVNKSLYALDPLAKPAIFLQRGINK